MKTSNITAIILAGGLGTRIRGINDEVPKPLIRIGKYNLLEYNLLKLKREGVTNFVISLGYKADMVRDFFGNGSKHGVNISYSQDPQPLGDAGAFRYIYQNIRGTALFVNADDIRTGLDLRQMLAFHEDRRAISTVALIEQEDLENHGICELDGGGRVNRFLMNPTRTDTISKYANSGFYLMEEDVLAYLPEGHSSMRKVLPSFVESGRFYGFVFGGLYFNVGNLEILKRARAHSEELDRI